MIQLLEGGTYLVNGTELVEPAKAAAQGLPAPEEAAKQTMAYNILRDHNTSGNMEKLQIKFDKLTSHDITFVGIIQTARASGLEKFPVPYVLTNCHNSLCAVGGTINEDDHMFGLTCAKKYGGVYPLNLQTSDQQTFHPFQLSPEGISFSHHSYNVPAL